MCKSALANYRQQSLTLLILLAYVARAGQVWQHNPMQHLWSDPLRHWAHASETLQAGPMAMFDPVGYQLWLSVVQKMTQGIPELVAVYVIALSWLTPWLWYRLLRELRVDKTLALLGWALLAWSPSWLVVYSYFMTETLLLPLLGLALWLSCRADRKKSASAFYLAVLAWTAAVLTRGIVAPMAAVALLLIWLKRKDKIATACVSLILLGLVFLPLAYRNHQTVGLWSPVGNVWLNKIYAASGKAEIQLNLQHQGAVWNYGFSSPSMGLKPFLPLSGWMSRRSGVVTANIDFSHGELDWSAAFAENKTTSTSWLYWENLAYLLCGPSWPDDDPSQLLARAQTYLRWLWLPMFALVLIGSAFCWRQCADRPVLIAVLLTWLAFQAGMLLVVNEGRYRKPAEGLVICQLMLLIDSRRKVCSHD